jgi:hypothetical protein
MCCHVNSNSQSCPGWLRIRFINCRFPITIVLALRQIESFCDVAVAANHVNTYAIHAIVVEGDETQPPPQSLQQQSL